MLALACILSPIVSAYAAAIRLDTADDTAKNWRAITISGELQLGDENRLLDLILQETARQARRKSHARFIIMLDSGGGNVSAALAIGRVLREIRATVIVAPWGQCGSACVYVLAGGSERIVLGRAKIGIHRPTFDEQYFAQMSPSEARHKYAQLEMAVREYLRDMGMPDALFDHMRRIPNRNVAYLSEDAIHAYTLSGLDPAIEEFERARAKVSMDAATYATYLKIKRCEDVSETAEAYALCAERVRSKAEPTAPAKAPQSSGSIPPRTLPSWQRREPAGTKSPERAEVDAMLKNLRVPDMRSAGESR